jgi:hypothetical protein
VDINFSFFIDIGPALTDLINSLRDSFMKDASDVLAGFQSSVDELKTIVADAVSRDADSHAKIGKLEATIADYEAKGVLTDAQAAQIQALKDELASLKQSVGDLDGSGTTPDQPAPPDPDAGPTPDQPAPAPTPDPTPDPTADPTAGPVPTPTPAP